MATKHPKPPPPPAAKTRGRAPTTVVDSAGKVRIYADIPENVATELGVLALRRRVAKKDLIADILAAAVQAA